MRILIALAAMLMVSNTALASACYLDADISGKSFHLGWGGMKMQGEGAILCYDKNENGFVVVKEVMIEGVARGLGLGVSAFEDAKLVSTGIGLVESPEALLGRFFFVKLGTQLGPVGVDGGATLLFNAKKGKQALGIPFSLQLKSGKGLQFSGDVVKVMVTEI